MVLVICVHISLFHTFSDDVKHGESFDLYDLAQRQVKTRDSPTYFLPVAIPKEFTFVQKVQLHKVCN